MIPVEDGASFLFVLFGIIFEHRHPEFISGSQFY
jgi:hypothetical protein